MLEFVDSDLYFVQYKNNFINSLLQVGSASGSVEKSTGSSSLIKCMGHNLIKFSKPGPVPGILPVSGRFVYTDLKE